MPLIRSFPKPRSGFTMIELLVILAVLAIMLRFAMVSYGNAQSRFQLREEATDLAQVLTQARTEAQRYNTNVTVTLNGTTAYRMTRVQAGTPIVRNYSLPAGYTISSVSGGSSVTYLAPYGEVATTGVIYRIIRGTANSLNIGIAGLTGKVVIY